MSQQIDLGKVSRELALAFLRLGISKLRSNQSCSRFPRHLYLKHTVVFFAVGSATWSRILSLKVTGIFIDIVNSFCIMSVIFIRSQYYQNRFNYDCHATLRITTTIIKITLMIIARITITVFFMSPLLALSSII